MGFALCGLTPESLAAELNVVLPSHQRIITFSIEKFAQKAVDPKSLLYIGREQAGS